MSDAERLLEQMVDAKELLRTPDRNQAGGRFRMKDLGVRSPRRDDTALLLAAFTVGVIIPRGVAMAALAAAATLCVLMLVYTIAMCQLEHGSLVAGGSE